MVVLVVHCTTVPSLGARERGMQLTPTLPSHASQLGLCLFDWQIMSQGAHFSPISSRTAYRPQDSLVEHPGCFQFRAKKISEAGNCFTHSSSWLQSLIVHYRSTPRSGVSSFKKQTQNKTFLGMTTLEGSIIQRCVGQRKF